MKKILLFAVIATAMMVTSCGTSKQATSMSKVTGDVLIESNPCEEYAMEKPAQRAVGVGQHFQEATAKNQAELQARAALAKALQTCIETTTKDYADDKTMFSADDVSGQSITDQTAILNDRTEAMSKELVKGASVAKVTKYRTPNNQYKVYVCVEYSEDVAQMAGKVSKSFGEMLSQDQKIRIDFNEQRFKKEMEQKMQEYKGTTMQ